MHLPRCQCNSFSQQSHPLTASMPMTPSNAVSVVLLTTSLRRLFRYFCRVALASSSVGEAPPLRDPSFLRWKYCPDSLRPSSSTCDGVKRGVASPSNSAPRALRSPLRGRRGGAGSAFTKLYPSSSASVPLSLGDCDVFLRFLSSSSDGGLCEGCRLVRDGS